MSPLFETNALNSKLFDADYRLKFVVLFHQFPDDHERSSHWDLMLEWDCKLITYALTEKPAIGETIVAQPLVDHRIDYLEYEGPVSNDRGSVSRVMQGEYFWVSDRARAKSNVAVIEFEEQRWKVRFEKSETSSLVKISFLEL